MRSATRGEMSPTSSLSYSNTVFVPHENPKSQTEALSPSELKLVKTPVVSPAVSPVVPSSTPSVGVRNNLPASGHNRTVSVTEKQLQNILKAHAQMRRRVANEILSTEESYVTGLATLVDKVQNRLLDLSRSWNSGTLTLAPLSEEEVLGIFSNAAELRNCHEVFLKKLRERFKDWSDEKTTIGDLFVDQLKYFARYEPYLQNYASASTAYHYIYAHNPMTKSIVDEFEKEQYEINKLNVPSFLVLPVQRLPRYVMLLSDLLKYTPKEHPDNVYLKQVCNELPLLVATINKTIDPARAASMQANVALASKIAGDGTDVIVRRERKFIGKMLLKKIVEENPSNRGEKTYRKGMLYIFDSLLVICKKTPSSKVARVQPYTLLSVLPLTSILDLVSAEKEIRIKSREDGLTSKKEEGDQSFSHDQSKQLSFILMLENPGENPELTKQLPIMVRTARQ